MPIILHTNSGKGGIHVNICCNYTCTCTNSALLTLSPIPQTYCALGSELHVCNRTMIHVHLYVLNSCTRVHPVHPVQLYMTRVSYTNEAVSNLGGFPRFTTN